MHVCILLCAQRVFYIPVLSEEKEKINIIITLIYTFSSTSFFPSLPIPSIPRTPNPHSQEFVKKVTDIRSSSFSLLYCSTVRRGGAKNKQNKTPPTAFITKFHPLVYGRCLLPSGWRELKSLFFIPSQRRSPGGQAGCYTGIPECCHFLSLCFIHGSNKSQTAGGVRRAFICGS